MSLPARKETYPQAAPTQPARSQTAMGGAHRAARLMRLLGPSAAEIWSDLSPGEASQLRAAMTGDHPEPTQADADLFIEEFRQPSASAPVKDDDVWTQLSAAGPSAIATLLAPENGQVIALALSRLAPESAAQAVRALPRATAIDALRRLLSAGPADARALDVIERSVSRQLANGHAVSDTAGHEQVARIFDRLDPRLEKGLLASLDETDPGVAKRIRALMFTFEDLAALDPAAIQTILSRIDRSDLALGLKGAHAPVRETFLKNMTKRAGDLLTAEMSALGPVRRSAVEAARAQITAIARTLAKRGDILSADADEDELIE